MKGRSFATMFFVFIIGLSLFGIVYYGVNFPADLLKKIITIVIVAGAIFILYKLFTNSNSPGKNRASYDRAAKQSKKKYAGQKQNITPLANNILKKAPLDLKGKKGTSFLKKKRKQTHLTVIEGKKGKKKNRASF
ncbi:SA1362 family protein [Bacillus sp. 165]|uniref:SA1362 family protein n=1 Tax=Bacillus sp. 165 TaxID=1529117 RepID=UPI001ADB8466|nr:SA1362 family protein [Bacillus sp. 165]MBO9129692.1 hypothetical protein [Bacillus sp. 165]